MVLQVGFRGQCQSEEILRRAAISLITIPCLILDDTDAKAHPIPDGASESAMANRSMYLCTLYSDLVDVFDSGCGNE